MAALIAAHCLLNERFCFAQPLIRSGFGSVGFHAGGPQFLGEIAVVIGEFLRSPPGVVGRKPRRTNSFVNSRSDSGLFMLASLQDATDGGNDLRPLCQGECLLFAAR